MSIETPKICIWCNKPLRDGELFAVIHIRETNALGIAPESCFHELKERLGGRPTGESAPVPYQVQYDSMGNPIPEGAGVGYEGDQGY